MNGQVTVKSQKGGEYIFSGDLDMHTVNHCWPDQHEVIQQLKHQKGVLNLDFTSVQHVDTSGLAWVMHLTKACQSENVGLTLQHLPEGLINLAKLSNVETLLPIQ